jgi:hypothetical protein
MKKSLLSLLILSLILFSFTSFVFSESPPMLPGQNTDIEAEELQNQLDELQNLTNQIPIDPATGEFNVSKVEGIKLKAEERIEKINAWLAANDKWFKFFLRMTPEISWFFVVYIYTILCMFTSLVLNGDDFFFFTSKPLIGYVMGLGLFLIGLVTHAFIYLATFFYNFLDLIINTIIPWGTIAFIVGIAILLILAIFFPTIAIFVSKIPAYLTRAAGFGDKTKKVFGEIEQKKKELDAYVEGMRR